MNKLKDESGQALIELIIFLPLMFTVYSLISGFAAAINGSINQQKISRAYFYYRVQNNSTYPKPSSRDPAWTFFGMYFIGWKEKSVGNEIPAMPCYPMSFPMARPETCDEPYSRETAQNIRVGTAYGGCGATYEKLPDGTYSMIPNREGRTPAEISDRRSCTIDQ